MFDTTPLSTLLANISVPLLVLLLGLAAWIDWRTMRIPNWLTVPGMAWGLYFSAIHGTSVGSGLLAGALGLVTGLLLLLPLFALRVLGAGDVKLLAMVGAFLGALATFKALLVIGVVGGVAALLFAVSHRALGRPSWRRPVAAGRVRRLDRKASLRHQHRPRNPRVPGAAASGFGLMVHPWSTS